MSKHHVDGAQFTSTNKLILSNEMDFWKSSLLELFSNYEQACKELTQPHGKDMKAFHASRIAGLSHALTAHMSKCVETLLGADEDSPDVRACIDSAERMFNKAMKHHNSQDKLAENSQS